MVKQRNKGGNKPKNGKPRQTNQQGEKPKSGNQKPNPGPSGGRRRQGGKRQRARKHAGKSNVQPRVGTGSFDCFAPNVSMSTFDIILGTPSSSFLEDAVELCILHMLSINPPPLVDMVGAQKLTPAYIKCYLMWLCAEHLRKVGALWCSANTNVNTLFIPPPEVSPIPTSLALLLRHYSPYDRDGVKLSFRVSIPSTYFTAVTEYDLKSANSGLSKSVSGLAIPIWKTSGNEFNLDTAFAAGMNPLTMMNDYHTAIGKYIASVVSTVELGKVPRIAPDASAYCKIYSGVVTCPVRDYNPELALLFTENLRTTPAIYAWNAAPADLPWSTLRQIDSASYVAAHTVMANYFICMGFAEWKGSIRESLKTTEFANLKTFAPILTGADVSRFWNIALPNIEKFSNVQEQACAMVVVWWSQLMSAYRRQLMFRAVASKESGLWVSTIFNSPFDRLPVPPAIAEYISGIGPVVCRGRVHWNVPDVADFAKSNTTSNWIYHLSTASAGGTASSSTLFWSNVVATTFTVPQVIGGYTFSTANFPSANAYVLVPHTTAKFFQTVYATVSGLQNFVPLVISTLGLIDNICIVVYDSNSTANDSGFKNHGYQLSRTDNINKVMAPCVLSSADGLRIATHMYQLNATDNSAYFPFVLNVTGLVDPNANFAAYFGGAGYNMLTAAMADKEKPNHGGSIGGFTTPSTGSGETFVKATREIANDYHSDATSSVTGAVKRTAASVADFVSKYAKDFQFQEYLPSKESAMKMGWTLAHQAYSYLSRRQERRLEYRPRGPIIEEV